MWIQIGMIGGFLCLLGAVVLLASKSGSKSAQLENLKAELKRIAEERARAQRMVDNVHRTDIERVREKLQATK